MGQIRSLLGQTATYGLSSIVGRLLNYILVPIYTEVFLPAEYGIVTELYADVAFLNILYTFGIETTFFRFASKSKGKEILFYHQGLSLILIWTAILSSLLYGFSDQIASLLDYEGKGVFIEWLAFILAIDTLVAIPFARLRLKGMAIRFASYKLINILANLLLNLFFLLLLPMLAQSSPGGFYEQIYDPDLGVGYVFLSNLLSNFLFLLFFLPDMFRFRFRLHVVQIRRMLSYAWPLVLIGFAGVTNEMFSRIMLKYLLPEGFYPGYTSQAALGIFGACYKLSVFMTLAVQAFKYAYEPFFFKISDQAGARDMYARVMNAFVIFGSFAWMLIVLVLQEIAPILLRQDVYMVGLGVVPWLLGGGFFLGIYYNLSVWYKLTDKNQLGALISFFGVLVTVLFNLLLIPFYGYMGSAYASFSTFFVMMAMSYWWGKKHYPINYSLGKAAIYGGYAMVFVALMSGISFERSDKYMTGGIMLGVFLLGAFLLERRQVNQKPSNIG